LPTSKRGSEIAVTTVPRACRTPVLLSYYRLYYSVEANVLGKGIG